MRVLVPPAHRGQSLKSLHQVILLSVFQLQEIREGMAVHVVMLYIEAAESSPTLLYFFFTVLFKGLSPGPGDPAELKGGAEMNK